MNDNFRELKARLRRLGELLTSRGRVDVEFAQAVSAVQRAAKHGDRTRDPSPELGALLERAETLGRLMTGGATP